MTGSAALDILIGLFTLYFVMSTLASALVEVISNLLGFRAKMLNTFLSLQFNEPQKKKSQTKLNTLYTSLGSKQIGNWFGIRIGRGPKYLSAVNAENFTQALYDAIGFTGNEKFDPDETRRQIENRFKSQIQNLENIELSDYGKIIDAFNINNGELQAAILEFKKQPQYTNLTSEIKTKIDLELEDLSNQRQGLDVIKEVNGTLPDWLVVGLKAGRAVDAGIEDFKRIIDHLPPSQIKNVLTNAVQKSEGKIADISTHVSEWFDGEMERLKDVYRRRTQVFLFLAGFLIAIWLNVDTIAIANALAKNPALRDAVVEQAKSITSNNKGTETVTWDTARTQLSNLGLPTDWDSDCNNDMLKATPTPISVTPAPEATPIVTSDIDSRPCWFLGHVNQPEYNKAVPETESAIPGILITAAAVALGAPFWFDLLKSLTSSSSSDSSEKDANKK